MIYFIYFFCFLIVFLFFRYSYITNKYINFYDRITELRLKFHYTKRMKGFYISDHKEFFNNLENRFEFIFLPKFWLKWKWKYIVKEPLIMVYIGTLEKIIDDIKE